jgi:hypothetical protein
VGWTGLFWLRIGAQRRDLMNTDMNLEGSITFWEIFEWLSDWRILKKGS